MFELVSNQAERSLTEESLDIETELVSDAIARTFELRRADETKERIFIAAENDSRPEVSRAARKAKRTRSGRTTRSGRSTLFGINRWLLAATILSVTISASIYVWAQYYTEEPATATVSARVVDLGKPELNQYVKTAKIGGETLFITVTPEFTGLEQDKRRSIVQQIRDLGETKAFRKVTFSDAEGKTVAFASAERIDIH